MDTVRLVEWLKADGDHVVKGEPLFVIETDKANMEIEAPATGVLHRVLAEAGSEVAVRARIGLIAAADEAVADLPTVESVPEPESARPAAVTAGIATGPSHSATGPDGRALPPERQNRIFASPRARRLAEQFEIALADVKATGPQDMVVERDVRAFLAERTATPAATPLAQRMAHDAGLDLASIPPERSGARITRADVAAATSPPDEMIPEERHVVELSPMRQTIARRLVQSQQTSAHVTLTRELDATELDRLRQQILRELPEAGPRPSYTDFLITIVARQLKQHLHLNATSDGKRVELSEGVHMGVAVDSERGLVVPVIRNADQKGLLDLCRERLKLIERARDGAITLAELDGGSFTITNLGTLGIDAFTPIINPPQVAILGVGRIRSGPAVHSGELCIRQLMVLSLTFDHRLIDGAPAARFLADIVRMIEKPHLRWLG
jgi:pyruvate dehydrogenase E2 component (dihydrolipoamide acetyltransferase)